MTPPVAFVTGAGRGVGRVIARRFASEGYGIAVVGRSRAALDAVAQDIQSAGGVSRAIVCDVARRDDVYYAVREVEHSLGPIDVLVNNAGIAESAPFASMPDELWERTLAVNLTGTYHCMRAIVPAMFERKGGRVINIASAAAKVGFAYTAAYVASKHGVLGLTRAVALEAESKGVTINAICPGWLNTDMTDRSIARIVAKTGRGRDDVRRMLAQMNPQGRLIEPDEVAEVAVFLASRDGARTNGQAIDV
jgi:NAD(P)-dependent dehydrogenase (short-subunit alcohol dehydrogenase family)